MCLCVCEPTGLSQHYKVIICRVLGLHLTKNKNEIELE